MRIMSRIKNSDHSNQIYQTIVDRGKIHGKVMERFASTSGRIEPPQLFQTTNHLMLNYVTICRSFSYAFSKGHPAKVHRLESTMRTAHV